MWFNKFLNVSIQEKSKKKFSGRFPLKEYNNIDILDSITMAWNINVTLIRNIIIFKRIYQQILLN